MYKLYLLLTLMFGFIQVSSCRSAQHQNFPLDNESSISSWGTPQGYKSITNATFYNCREPGQCSSGVYDEGSRRLKTNTGETFDPNWYTAAHNRTEPGTILRVSHEDRSVDVCINDTGGMDSSTIDLSEAAFKKLSPRSAGRVNVRVQKLGRHKNCQKYMRN